MAVCQLSCVSLLGARAASSRAYIILGLIVLPAACSILAVDVADCIGQQPHRLNGLTHSVSLELAPPAAVLHAPSGNLRGKLRGDCGGEIPALARFGGATIRTAICAARATRALSDAASDRKTRPVASPRTQQPAQSVTCPK
jgi:hypothetical protein